MAVTNPVLTYVATINAGTNVTQSSTITATVNLTAGFEMLIPFEVQFSNVSADPIISFYRTTDGGVTFETSPMFAIAIPRVTTGRGRTDISLKTGMYAVTLLNSGPNTATFFIGTQQIITAYDTV